MLVPSAIDPATLAARLLDPVRRRELFDAMDGERGSRLPLTNAYATAARLLEATPVELRRIVELLDADGREDRLDDLLFHPQMPEDVLLDLCERGVCVDALGHRGGPRRLLQRVVELHAYPEAILSLALDLYRDPGVPAPTFAAFARAHASSAWMLRALAEVDGSDIAKERAYEELLSSAPDAAAFHARHMARSERVSLERLASFLASHRDPQVLVLLLRSTIQDTEKRVLVERLAEDRGDDPEIHAALAGLRVCAEAASPDLTPAKAAELFAAGEPEVLLALAGNPRTPRALLVHLAVRKGSRLARAIRIGARETLRGRGNA